MLALPAPLEIRSPVVRLQCHEGQGRLMTWVLMLIFRCESETIQRLDALCSSEALSENVA